MTICFLIILVLPTQFPMQLSFLVLIFFQSSKSRCLWGFPKLSVWGFFSQITIEHVSFPLFDTPSSKYHQLINFCVYVCKELNNLFPLLMDLNLCTFVSNDLMCYKILQQIIYLDFLFLLACCPFAGLYMLLSSTSLWNLRVFQLSLDNLTLVSFL